jgi:hypothetical protein
MKEGSRGKGEETPESSEKDNAIRTHVQADLNSEEMVGERNATCDACAASAGVRAVAASVPAAAEAAAAVTAASAGAVDAGEMSRSGRTWKILREV